MQTDLDRLAAQLGSWRWMLLVAAALDSGIVRALGAGPLGPDDLAGQLGLEPRATCVVAEALVEGGFLQGADGRWGLTGPARRLLLDETDPAYTAPSVLHGRDLAARWLNLPEILKGQRPATRPASGPGTFTATMALGARTAAPVAVAACLAHFPGTRRVLDVGGGPGVYARAFLDQGLAVTIFDLPPVIELVRPQWAGVTEATLAAGDFTAGLPAGPFDLALLGNVCHIYGPDENRRLFQRVAAALAPGGGVAIIDFVRGRSPMAALFGVNMLSGGGTGGTWTEAEYRAWLAEAGFAEIQVEDTGATPEEISIHQRQLIFATLPAHA